MAPTKLPRLFSLAILGLFAAFLPSVRPETPSYPYQFNHVAVTGGGYITGIIAHPTEANLLYVRTDIGGAYRWSQDDNRWIPLTDSVSLADSNLLGTESIGLDPTDPDRLYLAQGRYLTSNNSAFWASTDRGETFTKYPAPFPMGSNELGRNNGERLAVNPFNTNEVWFGSRTEGLWKSTDYAATWSNVTSLPDAFTNDMGIYFVIFDTTRNGTVYVGGSTPGGLYVSHNGGTTWKTLPGQPTTWENSTLVSGETPLSSGPQPMKAVLTPNGKTLYVTYADYPGPYGAQYGYVYKYETSTTKWTNITPGTNNNSFPPPYEPQAFPAGGFCGLSIDLSDPSGKTLVVTSLDRDPGPALDSLYISRDGGATWKDIAQLSSPSGTGGYWGHPISEAALENGTTVPWLSFDWGEEWGGYGAPSPIYGLTKFGWWMTALLMDPSNPGHVLYGTGATIWATDNIFAYFDNTTYDWYIQAQGIEETYAETMISPSSGPANLLSGFGDINGMRHDDLWVPQPMFSLPAFSNLDSMDWAGQLPSLVARVGDCGLNFSVYGACGQGAYSEDSGGNWTMFPVCAPGINETTTDDGVIVIDASGEVFVWSTLITQQANGPWASSDGGQTWTAPTGDLTVQTEYIAADKVQSGTFYAYESGTVYVSTDGGKSYNGTLGSSIGLPEGVSVTPVVSFEKAGELWLALGAKGLFHSTNFGSSWEEVGSELEANYFSVGKAAPDADDETAVALYLWGTVASSGAGSVDGLYRSDDGGVTWARVNDEEHQYGGPNLILGDTRVYGRVYIGTGGRGIVFADIAGPASTNGTVVNVPGTQGI